MKLRPSSAVYIAPFSWLIGTNLVVFHAISAWMFVKNDRRPLNVLTASLLAYILVYLFSLSSAAFRGEDLARLIASAYNLSFWVMGLMLLLTKLNFGETSLQRPAGRVIYFVAAVAVLFLAANGLRDLTFDSLLGSVVRGISLPPLVNDSMKLYIFGMEWADSSLSIRAKIMSPYPTALAAMLLLLLSLSTPSHFRDRKRVLAFASLWMVSLVLTLMTQSRAGLLSFLIFSALLVFVITTLRVSKKDKRYALVAMACLIFPVALILQGTASMLWSDALAYRGASSGYRFSLYQFGIERASSFAPLLGFGVKHDVPQFMIPVGSHSTFIGAFYKTGILGLLALLLFWSVATYKSLACLLSSSDLRSKSAACAFISLMPFFAFEDVDAPQFVAFLLFICMYLFSYRDATSDLD